MTVAELIEKLREMPQEAQVKACGDADGLFADEFSVTYIDDVDPAERFVALAP